MRYQVEIQKLVYGGFGLGRHKGKVVFVPYAAPGDLIEVEVIQNNRDHDTAEMIKLIAPGHGRIQPQCRYYTTCGGCQLQHLDQNVQLSYKAETITDAMARIAKTQVPGPIQMHSSCPWEYRNRVQWKYCTDEGRETFGFYQEQSNEVIDIESCLLLHPCLNKAQREHRKLAQAYPDHRGEIEAVVDSANQIGILGNGKSISSEAKLQIQVKSKTFALTTKTFFQCNRFLLDRLVNTVVRNQSGGVVVDLFTGVGLFSAFLVNSFDHVVGVESNKNCEPYYLYNCIRHGNKAGSRPEKRVQFFGEPVEQWLAKHHRAFCHADLVIIDPPRSGLSRSARQGLVLLKPKQIVYVSCNPSTVARDVRFLCENDYELVKVEGIDLFPQTFHVEAVAYLRYTLP